MTLVYKKISAQSEFSTRKGAMVTGLQGTGNGRYDLGDIYESKEVVTPSTNPGTPDGNCVHPASTVGVYSYFLGEDGSPLEITKKGFHNFKWNGLYWILDLILDIETLISTSETKIGTWQLSETLAANQKCGFVFETMVFDGIKGAFKVSIVSVTNGVSSLYEAILSHSEKSVLVANGTISVDYLWEEETGDWEDECTVQIGSTVAADLSIRLEALSPDAPTASALFTLILEDAPSAATVVADVATVGSSTSLSSNVFEGVIERGSNTEPYVPVIIIIPRVDGCAVAYCPVVRITLSSIEEDGSENISQFLMGNGVNISVTPLVNQLQFGYTDTSMKFNYSSGGKLFYTDFYASIPDGGGSEFEKLYVKIETFDQGEILDIKNTELSSQVGTSSITVIPTDYPALAKLSDIPTPIPGKYLKRKDDGTGYEWISETSVGGADGDSAYVVAVENGFVGTEAEWLASLVGDQGEQGVQGEQGIQGETGAQGVQGEQGIQGETGAQGIQGIQGDKGDEGERGVQGYQGIKGDTGEAGADGAQGLQGETGADGAQGIQGIQGEDGADGAQGIQGIQGEDGADGAQGIQGIQGEDGADGAQGIQGIQGETGADGADLQESSVITLLDANADTILLAGKQYIISAAVTIDLLLNEPTSGTDTLAISNKSVVNQTILTKTLGLGACSLYCTNDNEISPTWDEFTSNLI